MLDLRHLGLRGRLLSYGTIYIWVFLLLASLWASFFYGPSYSQYLVLAAFAYLASLPISNGERMTSWLTRLDQRPYPREPFGIIARFIKFCTRVAFLTCCFTLVAFPDRIELGLLIATAIALPMFGAEAALPTPAVGNETTATMISTLSLALVAGLCSTLVLFLTGHLT